MAALVATRSYLQQYMYSNHLGSYSFIARANILSKPRSWDCFALPWIRTALSFHRSCTIAINTRRRSHGNALHSGGLAHRVRYPPPRLTQQNLVKNMRQDACFVAEQTDETRLGLSDRVPLKPAFSAIIIDSLLVARPKCHHTSWFCSSQVIQSLSSQCLAWSAVFALDRWCCAHQAFQSEIPPSRLLHLLRRSLNAERSMLIRNDIIFVIRVYRLVLWWDIDFLGGKLEAREVFE
jgi:hypothetical protein